MAAAVVAVVFMSPRYDLYRNVSFLYIERVDERCSRHPRACSPCSALMQSRPDWTGTELAERLDVIAPHDPQRHRAPARARIPRRRDPRSRRLVSARGGREAAAAAARRRGGRRRRDRAARRHRRRGHHRGAEPRAREARCRCCRRGCGRRWTRSRATVDRGPENIGTDAPDPEVDPAALAAVGAGDPRRRVAPLRLPGRRAARRAVPPAQLAAALVPRRPRPGDRGVGDLPHGLGRAADADAAAASSRSPLPGGDFTAFVLRSVASSGWNVHARLRVDAPAEAVLARINPTVGVVESVDDDDVRARHGRRQPRHDRRVHRHARDAVHRRVAGRAASRISRGSPRSMPAPRRGAPAAA